MATVVAFHAYPDDEVMLTPTADRLAELRAGVAVLGAHRVVHLGYADGGYGPVFFPDPPGRTRFARAETGAAARRLVDVLCEERADLLISYEANGGYGHRDHVKVHEAGERAAQLAATPRTV